MEVQVLRLKLGSFAASPHGVMPPLFTLLLGASSGAGVYRCDTLKTRRIPTRNDRCPEASSFKHASSLTALYITSNSTMTVQTTILSPHSRTYSSTSSNMDQSDDKEDRKREVSLCSFGYVVLVYTDKFCSIIVLLNENSVCDSIISRHFLPS